MRKLVIISHTEHQINEDGNYVGWGPTVNEINYLSNHWEEVVHVACLEKNVKVRGSSVGYNNNNIRFVPIPTFGGKKFWQKLDIIWKMPLILWKVQKSLKGASHVQLRVPMGIGIFLIPYFAFRRKSKYIFWVKYANNWGSNHVPFGYRMQRWLLKKNITRCRVTINGFWPDQPKHCLSFENPCLKEADIQNGQKIIENKNFYPPFHVVFVGRIDERKGVDIIIEFILNGNPQNIGFFHIVGEGELKFNLEQALKEKGIEYKFYGGLSQKELFKILSISHAILLPSKSEGFPKVLAEAMNFGCIPIASGVGSIGHYIRNGIEGFILGTLNYDELSKSLDSFNNLTSEKMDNFIFECKKLAHRFTFQNYLTHLQKQVFNGI